MKHSALNFLVTAGAVFNYKVKTFLKYCIFAALLILLNHPAFSQEARSLKSDRNLSGAVTLTNNGISLIPTFSLGKPAVIFDASFGKRLTFDPQLKFGLNGQPWGFIFWWRYKIINNDKFRFNIGAHPALVYKTVTDMSGAVPLETLRAQRFIATEVFPNYLITRNISVGLYYLYSYCFEKDLITNTNFVTLNVNFTHIKLTKMIFVKFNPQAYYLKMDQTRGYYITASMALAGENFPLSIGGIINKSFQSDIVGSKDFVWNISLIYSFSKRYIEQL